MTHKTMTIAETIRKYKENFFFRGYFKIKRKQRFLKDIITTRLFSKMKLSDKLTAMTKLVQLSKRDFGTTPKNLEKKLLKLSRELRRQEIEQFRAFRMDEK